MVTLLPLATHIPEYAEQSISKQVTNHEDHCYLNNFLYCELINSFLLSRKTLTNIGDQVSREFNVPSTQVY